MSAWAIKDWETKFSNADAARRAVWRWVPIPISLTGERYRTLMSSREGREAFSVFISLCEVAANLNPRGILRDERGPLKATTLSVKTGIPAKVIENAIGVLASGEIEWLVSVPDTDGIRTPCVENTHYPTPPNPTIPDQTKTPQRIEQAPSGTGLGGDGEKWGTERVFAFLVTVAGVNRGTARRLAAYPQKLAGVDLPAEWERLKAAKTVASPAGALVKLLAQKAGIDLDTQSAGGDLQRIVEQRRRQAAEKAT